MSVPGHRYDFAAPGPPSVRRTRSAPWGRRMSASIRGHRSPPGECARRRFRGCRRPGPARGRSTATPASRSNAGRLRSRASPPAGRKRRTAADRPDGSRPAAHIAGLPRKPSVALPVQSGKTAESENSVERSAGFGIAPSVVRSRRHSGEAEKTLCGALWALGRPARHHFLPLFLVEIVFTSLRGRSHAGIGRTSRGVDHGLCGHLVRGPPC